MIKGYAETSYKGRQIRFGFMPDFGEWASLCDDGIFEGSTREDVVNQAKKAIDERAAAAKKVIETIRSAPPADTTQLDRLVAEVRRKIKEDEVKEGKENE